MKTPKPRPVPAAHLKQLFMSPEEAVRAERAQAEAVQTVRPRAQVRLVIVADASPSMSPYEDQVRSGLYDFLRRLDPAVPFLITLIQFDRTVRQLATRERIAQVIAGAAIRSYSTLDGDGTALWDAIAQGLAAEDSSSDPVLFLVATDGEDNMSYTSFEHLAPRIRARQGWGNWTYLWLDMAGGTSPWAEALGMPVMYFAREDIGRVLGELAGKLSRAVKRMQLAGGSRIPNLLES